MFNLILFFLTRPKVVVGSNDALAAAAAAAATSATTAILPTHRRHDSGFSSSRKQRLDSDHYGGLLSFDIENYSTTSRPDSSTTFELQSPSRTMHRTRSSYDFQGSIINISPISPTRNGHHRWASSEVLDIG